MESTFPSTTPPRSISPIGIGSFVIAVLVGSGSVYPADRIGAWAPFVQQKLPFVVRVPESQFAAETPANLSADLRTAAQHMVNIRNVLKLPMSVLSGYFGISRQAIYKWISGASEPEDENKTRIELLSRVADSFQSANVVRPDTLIMMKAFSGLSLMEMIKSGGYRPEHIDALIDEARRQDEAYQRSGIRQSRAPSTNDWRATVSIPGWSE